MEKYFAWAVLTCLIMATGAIILLTFLQRPEPEISGELEISPSMEFYAYSPIDKLAGLGHKMYEVICGYMAAKHIGAQFTLDLNEFNKRGLHGAYGWFIRRFLQEQPFPKLSELQHLQERILRIDWSNVTLVQPLELEEAVYRVERKTKNGDGCFAKCHRCWSIFEQTWRNGFSRDAYLPKGTHWLFSTNKINIAWHLRVGDIYLGPTQEDAKALGDTLLAMRRDEPLSDIQIHFFFDGNGRTKGPPHRYEFLTDLFPTALFHTPDEETTLDHFISADVAIGEGSSFFFVFTLVSDYPVYISAPPKGGARHFDVFQQPSLIWWNKTAFHETTQMDQLTRLNRVMNKHVS